MLARHPNRFEELTAAALSAIAPCIRRTARVIVVVNVSRVEGNQSSNQWRDLTHSCQRLEPSLGFRSWTGLKRCCVRALRWPAYAGQLDARRLHARATYGWPGMQGPVNGIVGWGGAQAEQAGAGRRVPHYLDGELSGGAS